MRAHPCCTLLLAAASISAAGAATWQVAAGPTRSDGTAAEVARATVRWETALGYVSDQRVNVRTEQDTCFSSTTGPVCVTNTATAKRRVSSYGYLSVQRKFAFRPDAIARPVLGIGFVVNTDTNAYVSSPVTFSLSAGLRLGRSWAIARSSSERKWSPFALERKPRSRPAR